MNAHIDEVLGTAKGQLYIHTTAPEVPEGSQRIAAFYRSKGKQVDEADKMRAIIVPAFMQNSTLTEDCQETLLPVLADAFADLALAQFRKTLADNPAATTVAAADYSVSALLLFAAAERESKRVAAWKPSAEDVRTWFAGSQLRIAYETLWLAQGKDAATLLLDFGKTLAALVSKPSLSNENALKVLARMAEPDVATATGAWIAGRLDAIGNKVTAESLAGLL